MVCYGVSEPCLTHTGLASFFSRGFTCAAGFVCFLLPTRVGSCASQEPIPEEGSPLASREEQDEGMEGAMQHPKSRVPHMNPSLCRFPLVIGGSHLALLPSPLETLRKSISWGDQESISLLHPIGQGMGAKGMPLIQTFQSHYCAAFGRQRGRIWVKALSDECQSSSPYSRE